MNKGTEYLFRVSAFSNRYKSFERGCLCIFLLKRDAVKILRRDTDGFILYHKRLEEGIFELPRFKPSQGFCKIEWEVFL